VNKIDKVIEQYIKQLRYEEQNIEDTVLADISDKDYKQFWSKKRESTSTSQFGLHIGHFKTGILNEMIMFVHKTMMLLPFIHGFSPKLWCRSIKLML